MEGYEDGLCRRDTFHECAEVLYAKKREVVLYVHDLFVGCGEALGESRDISRPAALDRPFAVAQSPTAVQVCVDRVAQAIIRRLGQEARILCYAATCSPRGHKRHLRPSVSLAQPIDEGFNA